MIFLSYSWAQSDYADQLEQFLKERHFTVLRDKNELKATDDISEFMRKLGTSDYAILMISEAYLKSYNCLYEALIAYDGREKNNVIPVVFPDADVFNWRKQLSYITFWHEEKERLEEEVKVVPSYKATKLAERIRQTELYSSSLQDLLEYIEKRKCILSSDPQASLEQIRDCLYEKILSREIRPRPVERNTAISILEGGMLAVDFGTSYTLISVVDERGKPILIPDSRGEYIHRSTIEFSSGGGYLVGTEGTQAIRHIKRAIGVRESISVGKSRYSIPLLIAMILKSMARNAEEYLGAEIRRVIMAVPTDFSLAQRQVLQESARIAGLDVVRFVQEPSAEALLAPDQSDDLVAFIDLGGGTLDIALADVESGFCEILYSDGDSHFGSLDFDERLENLLKYKLSSDHGIKAKELGFLAEQIKCLLGKQNSATVNYQHSSKSGDIRTIALTVTRKEFESVADKLSRKFADKLLRLRQEVNSYIDPTPLKAIYLTGQGTKLYILRKLIDIVFPGIDVVDQYQESALIRGLSIQNMIMTGTKRDGLLLDAIPSRIVLMCSEGGEEKAHARISRNNQQECTLIEANTTIPTKNYMALDFKPPGEEDDSYPLEFWEITVSGQRNLLTRTHFTPEKEKEYEVDIDIDSASGLAIRIRQRIPGERFESKTIQEFRFC